MTGGERSGMRARPAPPPSLHHWGAPSGEAGPQSVHVDCGWGRLLFGQTFASPELLAEALLDEAAGERDIAFYVRDPHVVLSLAPQALFLDPSHAFRLSLRGSLAESAEGGVAIRAARPADESEINRLYSARGMVALREGYCGQAQADPTVTILVAEAAGQAGGLVGVVMGVDHVAAFGDAEEGASLWALAVDPQAPQPGIGRALVVALADRFRIRGRSFLDLSVMHDNEQAIALYQQLGFEQVPVYCVKTRNPINQNLYIGPAVREELNIYARIIVDEARRRGIAVEIEDAEAGLFALTYGARSVRCRESLSDFTTAVALSRCDDKALSRRLLARAGVAVPEQIQPADTEAAVEFLGRHGRIVVKPARGEQGRGVFVDLRSREEVIQAFEAARHLGEVVAEEFVSGEDLRVIVIDGQVVAAALRRPAQVVGDGVHTIIELIEKQSRRRAAATGGESRIPLDEETERCVRSTGHGFTDVLGQGEALAVRKTANLHTGGTIHDVTDDLHPEIAAAAVKGAEVLQIPVVGFDFIVEAPDRPFHRFIEANERPGLANHEPQPTAERFVDFLFPETRAPWRAGREARG